MQKRSVEMLETLRKSTKKFSAAELMQFVSDVKSADTEELASILNPPQASRTPRPTTPTDPFVKRLDSMKKQSGMKAADALKVLKEMLNDQLPSMKVPAKTLGSYPALLKVLRGALSDDEVSRGFEQASDAFKAKYSVRYDLS